MFCDNKKRFAVYTSGNCTRIKKAIEKYPELLCRIKFIITDECENLVLKQYFNKLGIQYYNFDVKQIYNKEKRNFLLSNYIEEKLKQNNIDYCFTFGKHILKGRILEEYKYRLINFHPGIIPDVIGLNAIDTAIKEKKGILVILYILLMKGLILDLLLCKIKFWQKILISMDMIFF